MYQIRGTFKKNTKENWNYIIMFINATHLDMPLSRIVIFIELFICCYLMTVSVTQTMRWGMVR
jgi:hypothetical protein